MLTKEESEIIEFQLNGVTDREICERLKINQSKIDETLSKYLEENLK